MGIYPDWHDEDEEVRSHPVYCFCGARLVVERYSDDEMVECAQCGSAWPRSELL